jgi:hypothetical protein
VPKSAFKEHTGFAILATLGTIAAAWSVVLTLALLAGAPPVPFWLTVVGVPLVLPAFLAALGANLTRGQAGEGLRAAGRRRLRQLPRWTRAVFFVTFFGCWLSLMTAAIGLPGNAEIRNGQYVLNNHNSLTVVDYATYQRTLARQERIALGAIGGFGIGAATILAGVIVDSRLTTRAS